MCCSELDPKREDIIATLEIYGQGTLAISLASDAFKIGRTEKPIKSPKVTRPEQCDGGGY